MTGKVYLVGAGPGAPDLLTLRAARVLESADIVFHDALVHPDTLALARGAEIHPVGKRCGQHSTAQHFINKRLVDAAGKFRTVVRLKGGDPMLFGRAQEEIDALRQAGIDFEVVPGVTTALAAAAQTGISLTRRGISRNVSFVTPRVGKREQPGDWIRTVENADTAVIYMGAEESVLISQTLIQRGLNPRTPAILLEDVSLPSAKRIDCTLETLGDAAQKMGSGPVIILLGQVFETRNSGQLDDQAREAEDEAAAQRPGRLRRV